MKIAYIILLAFFQLPGWAGFLLSSINHFDSVAKLDKRLQFENRSIDILLQINTSFEESKFGVAPENAVQFARELAQLSHLNIKGLMTIGLFSTEKEKVRKCFRLLKNIQQQIIAPEFQNVKIDVLSMGMSNNLEVAIEEGATMIRVGTAIFGQRFYPDSYYWNEGKK